MGTTDDFNVDVLYASINDIQGTIRAIDSKIGLLFIIQLFPLANLGSIRTHFTSIYPQNAIISVVIIYWVFLLCFCGIWVLSLIASIKAIIAIDDPTKHIENKENCKGSFYSSGLYSLNYKDAFINRKCLYSRLGVNKVVQSLPKDIPSLIKELTFEQMKLVYIRDIKIIRQKWAFKLMLIWLVLGFICYIYSVFK